ncbi:hypothetical protein DL89DRAFT_54450 [Linderina pennispora]|uniref:Uncharacterized protein n=1 Tax=Linderina pennispora TaxID=61395 RepID=A0A1Y1W0X4_9FUNG|nr:uncharacterized protein DL89DRAFT_54450 [Linderina pennispora]ORX67183.1 hypothetical protein DL89DRAFT_54450 [Linderina pennispora]
MNVQGRNAVSLVWSRGLRTFYSADIPLLLRLLGVELPSQSLLLLPPMASSGSIRRFSEPIRPADPLVPGMSSLCPALDARLQAALGLALAALDLCALLVQQFAQVGERLVGCDRLAVLKVAVGHRVERRRCSYRRQLLDAAAAAVPREQCLWKAPLGKIQRGKGCGRKGE